MGLFDFKKKFAFAFTNILGRETDKLAILQGKLLALQAQQGACFDSLADAGFRVFSQWDEDGILTWLVGRLTGIPNSAVEIGVGSFSECNTRFLCEGFNWSVLALEGSAALVSRATSAPKHWRRSLTIENVFVEPESIDDTLAELGCSGEIGILSIDIDGMDYWVWDSISVIDPYIVCVEYNTLFGDLIPLTVPLERGFDRRKLDAGGLVFGASIKALIHLGKQKGYRFVGTSSFGCNAFFVKESLAIATGLDSLQKRMYPLKAREGRNPGGVLTFRHLSTYDDVLKKARLFNLNSKAPSQGWSVEELWSASWLTGKYSVAEKSSC
jgi:hypothetical protein